MTWYELDAEKLGKERQRNVTRHSPYCRSLEIKREQDAAQPMRARRDGRLMSELERESVTPKSCGCLAADLAGCLLRPIGSSASLSISSADLFFLPPSLFSPVSSYLSLAFSILIH